MGVVLCCVVGALPPFPTALEEGVTRIRRRRDLAYLSLSPSPISSSSNDFVPATAVVVAPPSHFLLSIECDLSSSSRSSFVRSLVPQSLSLFIKNDHLVNRREDDDDDDEDEDDDDEDRAN